MGKKTLVAILAASMLALPLSSCKDDKAPVPTPTTTDSIAQPTKPVVKERKLTPVQQSWQEKCYTTTEEDKSLWEVTEMFYGEGAGVLSVRLARYNGFEINYDKATNEWNVPVSPGTDIELPEWNVYTVKAGDTWSGLAAKAGISVEELKLSNSQYNPLDGLKVGMVLTL